MSARYEIFDYNFKIFNHIINNLEDEGITPFKHFLHLGHRQNSK